MELNAPGWKAKAEVSFGDRKMTAEQVQRLAKERGWADPQAFNTGMLENIEQGFTGGGESGRDPASFGSARFKEDVAKARGIDGSKRNQNKVEVRYKQNEDGSNSNEIEAYVINAGAVPGKRHTRLSYEYDKDGNFKGANTDTEEKGLEGAAPLVGMLASALTLGGAGGMIGSKLNAGLGLGLGTAGQAALGGAAIGGGTSLLTGQNPLKGAALGGMGGAISAWNPAGKLGFAGSQAKAVNSLIGTVGRSAVTGKRPSPIGFGMTALQAGGWR